MTDFPITPDTLEAAHWLIAGTTGSGKTFLERGLLEQLRRAGRRVGAIDPRSKLWGLTVSADGKGPGLEFVIFGGKRPGAVPMRPSDGDRIGRLFIERNIPAIFDLYGWDEDDQALWVDAFARAIFAANTAALHLAIDEVQTFVPSRGAQGLAYKAIKLLATQGRGDGINLLMTAPRLDGVDVDVRQALGGMVAMLQTSMADRKAVAELIGGHVSIDERALRDQLAELPTGSGFVWSPGTRALERVAFSANETFDSSRTPRHGDAPPPPIAVSSALVEELRAALAPPASTNDPSIPTDPAEAYKVGTAAGEMLIERDRRIAELESELAHEGQRCGELEQLLRYHRRIASEAVDRLNKLFVEDGAVLRHLRPQEAPATIAEAAGGVSGLRAPPAHAAPKGSSAEAASLNGNGRGAAGAIENAPPTPAAKTKVAPQRISGATAFNEAARAMAAILKGMTPAELTWGELALAVLLRPGSGWIRQAKNAMVEQGWIEGPPSRIRASQRLLDDDRIAGEMLSDVAVLIQAWADKLRGPGGDILLDLAAAGPGTRAEIGERIGMSPTSGWFRGGMKDLLGSGLAIEEAGTKRFRLVPFLESDDA